MFQKNTDRRYELEKELKNFIVHNPGMNLNINEICYFQGPANAVHISNTVVGTQNDSVYIGSRKKSGLKLGTGFSNSQNVRGDVAEKYPGYLFITNQRIVLSTVKYGFEIPLKQITTINFMSDGFSVMSKGKTYLVETESVNKIKKMIQINNEYMMLNQGATESNYKNRTNISNDTDDVSESFRDTSYSSDFKETENKNIPRGYNLVTKPNQSIAQGVSFNKNKSLAKKIIKALLWFTAVDVMLFMIFCFFITVDFDASNTDLWLYRLSIIFLFAITEAGILIELNIFKLKDKIPLIRSGRITGHIAFVFIISIISICVFLVPYSFLSDDFKNQISSTQAYEDDSSKIEETGKEEDITEEKAAATWLDLSKNRYKEILILLSSNFPECKDEEMLNTKLETDIEKSLVSSLYEYYEINDELPSDFAEAFTKLCNSEEYEEMFWGEGENAEFYEIVSNGFQISWKSDGTYYIDIKQEEPEKADKSNKYISDEDPMIFTLEDDVYTVGNCSFSISEIQVATFPFKIGSRSVFFRIYGTVKNNSNEETFFSTTKTGNIVGTYYGEEEDYIGGNNNCSWYGDKGKNEFSTGYTLAPGEERDLKIQATYTTTDIPTYNYNLHMDLYFQNNGKIFTLTIN